MLANRSISSFFQTFRLTVAFSAPCFFVFSSSFVLILWASLTRLMALLSRKGVIVFQGRELGSAGSGVRSGASVRLLACQRVRPWYGLGVAQGVGSEPSVADGIPMLLGGLDLVVLFEERIGSSR